MEEQRPKLDWLPSRIIYTDYPKYGIDVAAGAVASIAKRAGAQAQPETAESLAQRMGRLREWKREGEALLRSKEGKALLETERKTVFDEIERIVSKTAVEGWSFSSKQGIQWLPYVSVWGERRTLHVSWQRASHGIENVSFILRQLFKNYTAGETVISGEDPELLEEKEHEIHVTQSMEIRWKEKDRREIFSSRELANEIVKRLLRQVEI